MYKVDFPRILAQIWQLGSNFRLYRGDTTASVIEIIYCKTLSHVTFLKLFKRQFDKPQNNKIGIIS